MSKAKDLTGQRFERLTVIEKSSARNSGHVMWHCKCDCGAEKLIAGSDLLNGRTISCGCYLSEKIKEPRVDLTGKRYGKLIVIKPCEKRGTHKFWLCRCDCGNEKAISHSDLTSGRTRSCGCLRVEKRRTHGCYKEKLYHVWDAMKQRCNNPNNKYYMNYGGRGITICDEWKTDYLSFKEWSYANGYQEGLSIDRIDFNGNYEPSNCRWITLKEQQYNKTSNTFYEYNGETLTLKEWSDKLNLSYGAIVERYTKGERGEALFRPAKKKQQNTTVTINGETKRVTEWCKIFGLNYNMVRGRMLRGWSEDKLFEPKHGA